MGMPPQAAYEENIRLHARLARMREALEQIATYYEKHYRMGEKGYQAVIIARDALTAAQ